MKSLSLAPILFVFVSCAGSPKIDSPVALSDAIRTLPSKAVAGMSPKGRQEYLNSKPGDYDEATRRIHLYNDNPYEGGDAESMLFFRLFEDSDGRTIAASHSARPFADGREPGEADTFVLRLDSWKWVDITESILPSGVSRSWWFRFNELGDTIPCGAYEQFSRRDGCGIAYQFGKTKGILLWRNGRFHYKSNG